MSNSNELVSKLVTQPSFPVKWCFEICRFRMAHTSGSNVTSFEYYTPREVSFESPGLKLRCLGTFKTCWVVLGILEKVLFKKWRGSYLVSRETLVIIVEKR